MRDFLFYERLCTIELVLILRKSLEDKKKIFINHLYTLRQEARKMERLNKMILISCIYAGYICISFALFSMLR